MRFQPYPKYKPSGVEWLGDVPVDWEVLSIWMLFELGRGRVISHEEIHDNSGDFPVYSSQTENNGEMGRINSFDFEGEYLTWTTDGANAGTVFRRNGKFNCTNVCGSLKAKATGLALSYFLHTVAMAAKGFVRQDINPKLMNNVMAKIKVPHPPFIEQSAIATFLDRETTKIDTLIAKQEKLIELLKEKRQVVISHAVTKGLNPNAKMKHSGIEWLGEVPEHWEVSPLKWAVSLVNEKSSTQESGLEYVGMENIESWSGRKLTTEATYEPEGLANEFKSGDVLLGKLRPYLAKAWIANEDGCCSSELLVLRPHKVNSTYIHKLVLSQQFITTVDSSTYGSKMPRASWDFIGGMLISIPPKDEQGTISEYVEHETSKFDELIAKAEQAITLQKEHRTALISAAVTGKIDVRYA